MLLDPDLDVRGPVQHPAAEPEAVRAGAEVSPVAKRAHRCTKQLRGLSDGEQMRVLGNSLIQSRIHDRSSRRAELADSRHVGKA